MIKLTDELTRALVQRALEARENAYCPYSGFAVGAALLCGDGTVYSGCNIECASLSPGSCAERTAFFRAVNDGQRDFAAIAVAGGPRGKQPDSFCAPCGVCRQVMREFCGDSFAVIMTNGAQLKIMTLSELLPMSFGPENLQ